MLAVSRIRVLAGGLAVVAVGAVVVVLVGGSVAAPRTASPQGLASLPAAARGPIAAAVTRADPAYGIVGLGGVNAAERLRLQFSGGAVTVASGHGTVGLSLVGYGRGEALVRPVAAAPRAVANRVTYARGPLTEWYANGALGLEQGFDVARAPGGTGPLTVALRVSGNLDATLSGGQLALCRPGTNLRYAGLRATDAGGRVLPAWLELSGRRLSIRVADAGARYPLHIDPVLAQAELTAADGAQDDELGFSVASSDTTIVVGAPAHAAGGSLRTGAAYVFTIAPGSWTSTSAPAAVLTTGVAGDQLGGAVALSGDTVVAGALAHTVAANALQGSAYVFVKPAAGWTSTSTPTAQLTVADGAAGDQLGESVAVSGDTVVAGAPYRAVAGHERQGTAYVFVKPAGGWTTTTAPTALLTVADGAAGNLLGYSVAISGGSLVAGAPFRDVGSHAAEGAAYVFTMPAGGWTTTTLPTAELTAVDGGAGDQLGRAVALAGGTLVAGAPIRQLNDNAQQGAAYVYTMPATGWRNSNLPAAELTAPDGGAMDTLGNSVAVSGTTVVVGAPLHLVLPNRDAQGAAYVFAMPPGGWASTNFPTAELAAADGATGDELGWSVAAAGPSVVAGAPGHTVAGHARQGAVYVRTAGPPPTVSITSPANAASYIQAETVPAKFTCTAQNAALASCTGTVADGVAIDTGELGTHTFTATATDGNGSATRQTVAYTVVDVVPTVLSASQTHSVWREAGKLAHLAAKLHPIGTTFSFRLSQPSAVTLTFTRYAAGRTAGGRCVPPTASNRGRPGCRRKVTAGRLHFAGHAGRNKVTFDGRLSRTARLPLGRFAVVIGATAHGRTAVPAKLRFTIVAR
ncbi:MAG: hypothetical protein ACR2KV_05830 [Solirubrobacteraceae bacterium]